MAYNYKAQKKYDENNTVFIGLKLNKKTDAEIIELLAQQESKQGFIKKILKKVCENT